MFEIGGVSCIVMLCIKFLNSICPFPGFSNTPIASQHYPPTLQNLSGKFPPENKDHLFFLDFLNLGVFFFFACLLAFNIKEL